MTALFPTPGEGFFCALFPALVGDSVGQYVAILCYGMSITLETLKIYAVLLALVVGLCSRWRAYCAVLCRLCEKVSNKFLPFFFHGENVSLTRGENLMSNLWCTRSEALHLLGGISRETFRRLIKAGELPRGVRCGKLCNRWRRSELEEFMRKREEEAKR